MHTQRLFSYTVYFEKKWGCILYTILLIRFSKLLHETISKVTVLALNHFCDGYIIPHTWKHQDLFNHPTVAGTTNKAAINKLVHTSMCPSDVISMGESLILESVFLVLANVFITFQKIIFY